MINYFSQYLELNSSGFNRNNPINLIDDDETENSGQHGKKSNASSINTVFRTISNSNNNNNQIISNSERLQTNTEEILDGESFSHSIITTQSTNNRSSSHTNNNYQRQSLYFYHLYFIFMFLRK